MSFSFERGYVCVCLCVFFSHVECARLCSRVWLCVCECAGVRARSSAAGNRKWAGRLPALRGNRLKRVVRFQEGDVGAKGAGQSRRPKRPSKKQLPYSRRARPKSPSLRVGLPGWNKRKCALPARACRLYMNRSMFTCCWQIKGTKCEIDTPVRSSGRRS